MSRFCFDPQSSIVSFLNQNDYLFTEISQGGNLGFETRQAHRNVLECERRVAGINSPHPDTAGGASRLCW